MFKTNRIFITLLFLAVLRLDAQWGGQLRLALRSDPKTFDPLLVDDGPGETIRYLTGGVLVRLNRTTQKLQPELAKSWKISDDGRTLSLKLQQNVVFSDGTPFTAEDVVYTLKRMMDPALKSPTGDSFRSSAGNVTATAIGQDSVVVTFPSRVASLDRLLDQVVIQSSRGTVANTRAVLGPFMVAEHRAGVFIELRRNPNYWKKDKSGRRLPYLDSVRFDILGNKDIEILRFNRGELNLIDGLEADTYERLQSKAGGNTVNAGATTDVEMVWFNQSDRSPIKAAKKKWFQSREFRQAVSAAINREDMVRLVYKGYAKPAAGPVPVSSIWFKHGLRPTRHDPADAKRKLASAGFSYRDSQLYDSQGNPVTFSLITNAGNKTRARLASLIQEDLKNIGVQVNITTLDFPSLLERIGKTFDYDACLLGLVNVDPDPNAQMNVWLSSAANHQWNPGQKTPATPWEAEIDKLMRAQASGASEDIRRKAFGRVQEIVAQEVPFIYLVNREALGVISAALRNVAPAPLRPHFYWNAEYLSLSNGQNRTNYATTAAAR